MSHTTERNNSTIWESVIVDVKTGQYNSWGRYGRYPRIIKESFDKIRFVYPISSYFGNVRVTKCPIISFVSRYHTGGSELITMRDVYSNRDIHLYLANHTWKKGVPVPYGKHIVAKVDRLNIAFMFSRLIDTNPQLASDIMSYVFAFADELYQSNDMSEEWSTV